MTKKAKNKTGKQAPKPAAGAVQPGPAKAGHVKYRLPDPKRFPAWFKAWLKRNFIPEKRRVKEIFLDGLWRQNPVLVLYLGLCTFLMAGSGLRTALSMGLATTFVLTGAELLISMLRKVVPRRHHNITRTLCVATFTAAAELLMAAFFPHLARELGIYLPLIAVSSILPARTGDFAPEHLPIYAAMDGLAMGMGFTGAICVLGALRELFGNGTLWGVPIWKGVLPQVRILTQPAGGLLLLAALLALLQWGKGRQKRPRQESPKQKRPHRLLRKKGAREA